MKKKGAEILIECLEREGVEFIWGIPGGQAIPIFDALYDSKKIKLVLTRHEQGAAHMADGYSRSTGKIGVCVATSGPGATNLVTGLATAYMDSIPMIAITAQVPTKMIGNDAFQEADVVGITRPVTKHNYLVKDINNLAKTIREAFYIANTGRKGPVLIDLPSDVAKAETEFVWPEDVVMKNYNPTYKGNINQIKKAAEEINKAKKPVIYAGAGILAAVASKEFKAFAEKTGAPVGLTLLGLGCFPGTHNQFIGMLGMHGTRTSNLAMHEADLIIAIGARFDDRVTGNLAFFAKNAKIIHIDIDPTSISKSVRADIPIVGDAKNVLPELTKQVTAGKHQEWWAKINEWKKNFPLAYSKKGGLKPQFIIEQIYELTKGKAIVATEVGQHQMWTAQFFKFDTPRSFVSSGGLGTMGFGLPAAIGAQFGNPGKLVFDISGDGSIQMNIQELIIAVEHKLPIKIIILNNGCLGMVRQWQQLFWKKRYSGVDLSIQPDFVKLAEAYGAAGMRVTKEEEVKETLEKSLKINDRPTLIDFRVAKEENVLPMVPAGAAITDAIDYKDVELA
ncbi:MAG: acetolactate synthase, large subunit, biosynthetic type [Candidatus Firestonebacteria bacterium RIFOXYA2_FULL_40_8]|nr:MAG: acetolactate synthase, large subunit, biosynthetic type [Candidatus Firestonebacteria bacterium RIFOXYA2_FULL_40_8]